MSDYDDLARDPHAYDDVMRQAADVAQIEDSVRAHEEPASGIPASFGAAPGEPDTDDALFATIARNRGEGHKEVQSLIYNRKGNRKAIAEIGFVQKFLSSASDHTAAGIASHVQAEHLYDRLTGADRTDENLRKMSAQGRISSDLMTDPDTGGGTYGLRGIALWAAQGFQSVPPMVAPLINIPKASAEFAYGVAEMSLPIRDALGVIGVDAPRVDPERILTNIGKSLPFSTAMMLETSEAYRERGLDPDEHAVEVGGIAALKTWLETMSTVATGYGVGAAAKGALAVFGKGALTEASHGMLATVARGAAGLVAEVGVGGATEASQQGIDIFAANLALATSRGLGPDDAVSDAFARSTSPDALRQLYGALKEGLQIETGFAVMGLPLAMIGLGGHRSRARSAAMSAEFFKAAAEKVFESSNPNLAAVAGEMADESGLKTIRMGWEDFHAFTDGLDGGVVAKTEFISLGGEAAQYEAAAADKGELVMEAGKFLELTGRAGKAGEVYKKIAFNDQEMTMETAEKFEKLGRQEYERSAELESALSKTTEDIAKVEAAETQADKVQALTEAFENSKGTPEAAGSLFDTAVALRLELDDAHQEEIIALSQRMIAEGAEANEIQTAIAGDAAIKSLADMQVDVTAVEVGTAELSKAIDADTLAAAEIVKASAIKSGVHQAHAHAAGMLTGRWAKFAGEKYIAGGMSAVDVVTKFDWTFNSATSAETLGVADPATHQIALSHMAFDSTNNTVKKFAHTGAPGAGLILAHEVVHSFHFSMEEMSRSGWLTEEGKRDLDTLNRAYDLKSHWEALDATKATQTAARTTLSAALATADAVKQAAKDSAVQYGADSKEARSAARDAASAAASAKSAARDAVMASRAYDAALQRYSLMMERPAQHAHLYFERGEAPSKELAGVFAHLKKWAKQFIAHKASFPNGIDMLGEYSSTDPAEMTAQERESYAKLDEVFGKWFSQTDGLIPAGVALASIEAEGGAGTLLGGQVMAALIEGKEVSDEALRGLGFSRKEAEKYAKIVARDNAQAREELISRISGTELRARLREWNAQYVANRDRAAVTVGARAEYIALSILKRGEMPNGEPVASTLEDKDAVLKIDHHEALEIFGPEEVKRLNSRGGRITSTKGYPMSVVAAHLNTQDAAHLAHMLNGLPTWDAAVDAEALRITTSEIGAPITEAQIRADAEAALSGDLRAKRLRYELKHLASERTASFLDITKKVHVRVPSTQESRTIADAYVATMLLDDVKPNVFALSQRKNSRLAREAFKKGDLQKAAEYKLAELMAYEYHRSALSAVNMRRVSKRFFKTSLKEAGQKRLGKGGVGAQELFNQLAWFAGVKQDVTIDELARTPNLTSKLLELAGPVEAPFDSVAILQALVDTGARPASLTVAQASAALDAARFISRSASHGASTSASEARQSRADTIEELTGELNDNHDVKDATLGLGSDDTAASKLANGLKDYAAMHLKMEFLFDFLDAGKGVAGKFHQALFAPFVAARDASSVLSEKSHTALNEAFSRYTKSERKALSERGHHIASLGRTISKWDAIMVAMNWGNEGNRAALVGGQRGLTDANVQDMMGILDANDAGLIQDLFNEIESHWEASSTLHRRQTGITPGKVSAVPFTVGGVEVTGGYFPITIDRKQDNKTRSTTEEQLEDLKNSSPSIAMTSRGHLKARQGAGGRPLLLSPSVISNHLSAVIHDITHREAVLDAWFIVNDDQFANAVVGTVGRNVYDLFNPWLMSLARADTTQATNVMDKATSWMRNRVTGALLAFNHGTMLSQITGATLSINELGPVGFAKGMKAAFAEGYNPLQGYREAVKKSRFMADRIRNGYERETAEMLKQSRSNIESLPGITDEITNVGMQMIGAAQMLVDLPTWWGGYIQAMDGAVDGVTAGDEAMAIEHADSVVRVTQGDVGALSSSAIQRIPGFFKWLVMFYTFFGTQFNLLAREGGRVKYGGASALPKAALGVSMIVMTQVMDDLIRGRYAYDDRDDDDHATQVLKKAGMTAAITPVSGMIGVRDVAAMVQQQAKYGRVFYTNPVWGATKAAVQGAGALAQHSVDPEHEFTRRSGRDIAIGLGAAAGMPGLAAFKLGDALLGEGD